MQVRRFLTLAMVAIFSVTVAAQTSATKSVPGFTFVSPSNLVSKNSLVSVAAAAIPGGKKLMVTFSYDDAAKMYHYKSSVIDSKGRATAPSTFFDTFYQPIYNVSIVWVDSGSKTGGSAKSSGYAVVYILTAPYDGLQKKAYLYSIKLDEKGKALGTSQELVTFDSIQPYFFELLNVQAVEGGDTILVTLTAVLWQNTNNTYGPRKSVAYVLLTDLEGKAVGDMQSIALPNGSNYQGWQPFTPLWTGKNWFIPMAENLYTLVHESSYSAIIQNGVALYMLSVTPSDNSLKTKLSKYTQFNGKYVWIENASIVPSATGAMNSSSPIYSLVYGAVVYNPDNKIPLEAVNTRLFVQTFNKKGAAKGASKEILLPKRKHTIKSVDHNKYWEDEGSGHVSNVVLNGQGEPLVAIYRGSSLILKTNQTQQLWDSELGVYRIDLNKGKVTATQWSNQNMPSGYLTNLRLFNNAGEITGFADLQNYNTMNKIELFKVQ